MSIFFIVLGLDLTSRQSLHLQSTVIQCTVLQGTIVWQGWDRVGILAVHKHLQLVDTKLGLTDRGEVVVLLHSQVLTRQR